MNKQISYTTINHIARRQLGLTMNEYGVADLIYNLSNNPKGNIQGWCYAPKVKMALLLGLTEPTIHTILKKLIVEEVVEKHSETKHLKTTSKWYETVILIDTEDTKESLVSLKETSPNTKETLVEDTKESLVNNKSIDNNKQYIHADKSRALTTEVKKNTDIKEIKVYSRKPPEKQTLLQQLVYVLEDELKTSIVNWPKQGKALQMMLRAGYTQKQMEFTIKEMANDKFYEDKGFDLMTVANNIASYKAKARKIVDQGATV